MTWLQDFHFLRPLWLVGLVVPIAVWVYAYGQTGAQSAWRKVCDSNLLDFLLIKNNNMKKTKLNSLVWSLIALFLITALSGPTWTKKENPALSVENPVMILLNMSGEMWNKDVSPSRIERAKYVIKDLTKNLNNTESGLIVYGKEPFMITPLVEDVSIINSMLPALQLNIMPDDGDRLDRAIDFAVSRLQDSGVANGNLIVITSNVGERFDAALTSASKAAAQGFEINIINVSSKTSEKLVMVAEKGQGILLNYNQNYASLIKKINDITAKEIKQSKNMQTVWEDAGWYFLWLPALLLAFCFRRGAPMLVLLCMLSVATSAQAGWFLNNNQEALKEFEQKNYESAAKKFTDERWKAAASYKNGDYQAAYELYAKNNDATALYNQGNALAKSGKIADAIKKYESALQKQPDFPDAKFNLEYLKKQQQNQQKQQDKNNRQEQSQSAQNKSENKDEQKQSDKEQKGGQQDNKQQDNKQNEQNGQNQQSSAKSEEQQENKSRSSQNQKADEQDKNEQSKANVADDKTGENANSGNKAEKEASQNRETEKQQIAGENNDGNERQGEAVGVNDKKSPEEQEKIRARMQKFRQIPEDKGGLLRALIQREYAKRRYEK